jgi:hypothetical protein
MPIKDTAYARYYAKNREALVDAMKERYDPVKKAQYYEEHKDEFKANMKKRYQTAKAERNITTLRQLLSLNPPDKVKDKINALLTTDEYKTANKWLLKFLERQIPPPEVAQTAPPVSA